MEPTLKITPLDDKTNGGILALVSIFVEGIGYLETLTVFKKSGGGYHFVPPYRRNKEGKKLHYYHFVPEFKDYLEQQLHQWETTHEKARAN